MTQQTTPDAEAAEIRAAARRRIEEALRENLGRLKETFADQLQELCDHFAKPSRAG